MEFEKFEQMGPNDLVKVVVPQTLEIEKRFIEGDVECEIRSEVALEDAHSNQHCTEIIKRGGRVFNTVHATPLIVHSEESLNYMKQTLRIYAGI